MLYPELVHSPRPSGQNTPARPANTPAPATLRACQQKPRQQHPPRPSDQNTPAPGEHPSAPGDTPGARNLTDLPAKAPRPRQQHPPRSATPPATTNNIGPGARAAHPTARDKLQIDEGVSMFQLFLKSKKAIILSATVAVLSVVVLVGGIVVGQNKKTRFPANGYVMQVETSEDSQAVANQVRFASGTALNKKASSMITFKSEEGQTVESKSDAFIHYEDGSLASAYGMTLTDLARFPEGLIDNYYLDAMMVLENSGAAYTIQNNTQTMTFDNFILKTGDQKYLCVSPTLELDRTNGSDTIENGYLELTYVDADGMVVNATDGNSAWQFLADTSTITFANGAVLDLGRMELVSGTSGSSDGSSDGSESAAPAARLQLTGISVSADVGIVVENTTATTWTPPTFVNHAIDGKDGANGADGEAGEAGETGENGDEGEDGVAGTAGAAGENGGNGGTGSNGQKGAVGKDGENTDDDGNKILEESPFVNITSWDQTAGSVAFKMKAFNTELIQEGTTEAFILKTSNGTTIASWANGMDLKSLDEDKIWSVDSLEPDTEYKLIISAKVLKSEDDINGDKYAKSILVSRVFRTDENGFYIKKVKADYITEDNINDYNSNITITPDTACLGLQVTLSGNQKLQEISDVQISYVDKDTGVKTQLTDAKNQLSSEDERATLASTASDGSVYMLFNLESNTEYTIKATAKLVGGKTSSFEETYKTLKATPIVTDAMFDVNAQRFFISRATCRKDEDNALVSFDHEIYRYYVSQDLTGDCLKRKTTKDAESYIYLDGKGIQAGKDTLGSYYEYGNRINMTWFDNEKYVTKEVPRSTWWRAQHIADSNTSYVQLEVDKDKNEEITQNAVKARLVISPGSNRKIYVGDKDVHRILVQITSAGYTKVLYYSSLDEWKSRTGDSFPKGTTILSGEAILPLELTGLASGTTYSITVTAYFDASSSISQTVGSTVFKTSSN